MCLHVLGVPFVICCSLTHCVRPCSNIYRVIYYRQAVELTERTSPEQAASIREPLTVVNRRWEALLRGMVERQKQLEHALLHLGQFQHALNELLVWISKTDGTLDQLKPVSNLLRRKFCNIKKKTLTFLIYFCRFREILSCWK